MKSLLLATAFLLSCLTVARAQQEADEKYLSIYANLQQVENQTETGNPRQVLATLTEVHAQLETFQKVYPDWNPAIISFRLEDTGRKIAAVKARLQAAIPLEPLPATTEVVPAQPEASPAAEQALRAQLRAAQSENQTLQAKLKEALSSQPAAADASELARAQEIIRGLMKENDLMKASGVAEKNPDTVSALRQQLAAVQARLTAEQSRAEKLVAENTSLQHDLKHAGNSDAMEVLRSQNERLKAQLATLQSTSKAASTAGDQTAQLQSANAQIATLQSSVAQLTSERNALVKQVKQLSTPGGTDDLDARLKTANGQNATLQSSVAQLTSERDALGNQVKQLSSELDALTALNYEKRLRDLTAQRDDLARQLAASKQKKSRKNADSEEVQTLRARLAVAESQPSPFTPEELALFRQEAPKPEPVSTKRSIAELPSGSAELVASAQRHFSNHEFDAAEADYAKILEHDQNNGLALANLATIELQENKLAQAEKHITAAVAQSPNDIYNLSTLGYLRFLQEKYDDALDVLSRAAKLDPNNPDVQNYLGVTLSHKGLRKQAEAALRKAIEINPNFAAAHNNLAVVYLNQTPPSPYLARWHYQKAIAAGQPRNPDFEKLLADQGTPVEAP